MLSCRDLRYRDSALPTGDPRELERLIDVERPDLFVLGDLRLRYDQRLVTMAGRKVELTATEYELLRELSQNAGRVLTYDRLLRTVWGQRGANNPGPVRTFVKKLRRKLGDDAASPAYILTERAVGYRMPEPGSGSSP